ncbi:MAG TPA: cytochrome c nitrite reductase small subunit [Polyangiaceae bacterium]|nr:cytochrome c nitrite reductase small subunit [Polyangiaceae bacterium]
MRRLNEPGSSNEGRRAPSAAPLPTRWARWLPLFLAVCVGATAGIGGYTFRYAEGLSYFKRDPKACVNCHIMKPQYDAWQKSSHHDVAVCIDCHLPEAFIPKYLAKAENGWRHGEKFTTQLFVEPIVVQAKGREILQANCMRCHGELAHQIAAGATAQEQLPCTHCHAGVGHGEKAGLGGPLTSAERAAH